ncbi:MAG TPA: glycoside hydrolase family 31 protein [Myxococcota bacterium]|nr:glycoside hydrolase family 31 protein [Myxococcota bacterium]HRY91890.1 glycoside hydrolase family 31 protein [Myxococcota bacterium]HSA22371.1 glycoside hydrolase family 31 protein [Myxococcota bacterium]
MRVRLVFQAVLLACTAGCGAGDDGRYALDGFEVILTEDPAGLQILASDGRVLLDALPAAGEAGAAEAPRVLAAFRAATATFEHSFGSFRISEDGRAWSGATRLALHGQDGEVIRFSLHGPAGALAEGSVERVAEGELLLTLTAANPNHNRASLGFRAEAGEHFLGFGGMSFDVDHRGQRLPLWVEEDGIGKNPTDDYDPVAWFLTGRRHTTHSPMPLCLSSRGYAALLDTPARSIFHVASEAGDEVRVEAWEGTIRLHLFDGPDLPGALARLTARLGRPELPPAFAFAPWLDALFGSENVRRVAARLRSEGVPCSAIWTEDWRGGTRSGDAYTLDEDWEVDRALYPDFEALAADLHAQGFKFLTYYNTFLDSEVGTYAEAVSLDHTIRDAAGAPYLFTSGKFTPTSLVDLSSPAAVAWTKQKHRDGLALGADGYMADFAEWLPPDAVLASGEDAALAHNLYPVAYQRLNKELLDELRAEDGIERLFFVRSAYLGSQPLVSVLWAGDQLTDFSQGDGLPSVIPMGLNLGLSGFPYFAHDIGGYTGNIAPPTTRELWFRWVTLGALTPVMRTHHGRMAFANWSWESDAESIAHLRRWASLHLRLYPYLRALAVEAAATGLPLMRPLALHHPDFEPGWSATDQYLLGDRLYVAPVVVDQARTRRVSLPAGTYFPLLGGPGLQGGELEVAAPLEEIPVFVPAGALLVLLPGQVNSLVPGAVGAGVVTHLDIGDDRELWLWPGQASAAQGALTEESGLSYAWSPGGAEPPLTEARWNGQAVSIAADGSVELTGQGTLELDGQGQLTVTGGSAARRLKIVLRGE